MAMTGHPAAITSIRRIAIVVSNLDAAESFFAEAFDFERVEQREKDADFATLLGVPGAQVRQTIMRLGEQELGLLVFDPPGSAYPYGSTSTDLWFQHFAIIVSDMDAAYQRLQAVGGFSPITEGGPRILPPGAGSVSAFKFRDPDGHPLELLAFPAGKGPAYWEDKSERGLFLGIDHSAVSVSDTACSVAFYQGALGFALGAQTENIGVAQSQLDAVPNAVVTVTGLTPPHAPPHVELLGYRVGLRRSIPPETRANDIAATTFIMETDALPAIFEGLRAAGAVFVSPGIVNLAGAEAIAILDPDGHRIVIMQQTGTPGDLSA